MSKRQNWSNGNPMNWGTPEYNEIQARKARDLEGIRCLPEWTDEKLAAYQAMTHDFNANAARRSLLPTRLFWSDTLRQYVTIPE